MRDRNLCSTLTLFGNNCNSNVEFFDKNNCARLKVALSLTWMISSGSCCAAFSIRPHMVAVLEKYKHDFISIREIIVLHNGNEYKKKYKVELHVSVPHVILTKKLGI